MLLRRRPALAEKSGQNSWSAAARAVAGFGALALEAWHSVRASGMPRPSVSRSCAWLGTCALCSMCARAVPLRTTLGRGLRDAPACRLLLSTTRPRGVQTPTDAALAAPVFSQPADVAAPPLRGHPGARCRGRSRSHGRARPDGACLSSPRVAAGAPGAALPRRLAGPSLRSMHAVRVAIAAAGQAQANYVAGGLPLRPSGTV